MPKFSAYMRGEGQKGEQGDASGFGTVTANSYNVEQGEPQVSVSTSGTNKALNLDFSFGLQRGPTGNVYYATFEVDTNSGDLLMYTDTEYDGPDFELTDEGNLILVV